MEQNIICSGALFYSTSTKRFLLLQRTDTKTRGMWGLVGGRMRYTESAFEGLKREIEEEVGQTPTFKKVIPLIGSILSRKDAYLYLPESVDYFLKREDVCSKMKQVGFKNIQYKDYTFGVATLYLGDKCE